MPGRRDGDTNQWTFDSVQEFWDSKVSGQPPACVQRGSFVGLLLKGIVEDRRPRVLESEDIRAGRQPDALIVAQVQNCDRTWNWDRLEPPPPRTGKFSAFMDEVEEVAIRSGCQLVWIEKVANEFLPEKLERRGYQRMDRPAGSSNPDYVKFLEPIRPVTPTP